MTFGSKLVIFYFSGTGNAKQIGLWFSEFAAKENIHCQLFDIANTKNSVLESLTSDTFIAIISPIHGFNYPQITRNFIKRFPKGTQPIVLMNTRAGMKLGQVVTPGLTGIAFLESSAILRRKGYKIVGQIPFDMPSNWISIHPALSMKAIKYLHQKNYSRVEKYANKLFSGKTIFLSHRDIIQDILIAPVSIAYQWAGKYIFAKSFFASMLCTQCRLCEKECPVSAIKITKNRPFWTLKCESCMKCMNTCPHNAIETAHGLFLIVSIFASTLLSLILTKLDVLNIQSTFLEFLVWSMLFFILLIVFYKLQHCALKNKTIAKIISHTSLTYYKFWGRYHSITDNQWKR